MNNVNNSSIGDNKVAAAELIQTKIKKRNTEIDDELNRIKEKLDAMNINDRFNEIVNLSKVLPFIPEQDEERYNLCQRFGDIICPKLTSIEVGSFILHANRVKLNDTEVICGQAPQKAAEQTFWQAAMENTNLIIDLTTPKDVGEEPIGVHSYIPEENQVRTVGSIEIKCTKQDKLDDKNDIKLHTYTVMDHSQLPVRQKSISRLHYDKWSDEQALLIPDLNRLITHINQFQKSSDGTKPPFIHCRAGVGRTGTLAVGIAVLKSIEEGKMTKENYRINIDELILAGRYQRGISFVQNPKQYEAIFLLAKSKLSLGDE